MPINMGGYGGGQGGQGGQDGFLSQHYKALSQYHGAADQQQQALAQLGQLHNPPQAPQSFQDFVAGLRGQQGQAGQPGQPGQYGGFTPPANWPSFPQGQPMNWQAFWQRMLGMLPPWAQQLPAVQRFEQRF